MFDTNYWDVYIRFRNLFTLYMQVFHSKATCVLLRVVWSRGVLGIYAGLSLRTAAKSYTHIARGLNKTPP
jgi:hypothetical protein